MWTALRPEEATMHEKRDRQAARPTRSHEPSILMEQAIVDMAAAGASIVDPATLDSRSRYNAPRASDDAL